MKPALPRPATSIDFGHCQLDFIDTGQDTWLELLKSNETPLWSLEVASLALWRAISVEADLIIDVGSYNGLYAMVAAKATAAPIIAFEPMPTSYGTLVNNLRLNAVDGRVKAVNAALGERQGTALISSNSGPYVMTSGETLSGPRSEYRYPVCVTSLDRLWLGGPGTGTWTFGWQSDLFSGCPDLIKIDVEGFEAEVLAGMRSLIGCKDPQDFIVEMLTEAAFQAFANLLPATFRALAIHESPPGEIGEERIAPIEAWEGAANYWFTTRSEEQIGQLVEQIDIEGGLPGWQVCD